MADRHRGTFLNPISRRLNNTSSGPLRRSAGALLTSDPSSGVMNGQILESIHDDDKLAPVMPAIDVVQQLMDQERKNKQIKDRNIKNNRKQMEEHGQLEPKSSTMIPVCEPGPSKMPDDSKPSFEMKVSEADHHGASITEINKLSISDTEKSLNHSSLVGGHEEVASPIVRKVSSVIPRNFNTKQDEYEFIPKSVILDVYSNDPEVKRFLKQLPRIGNEHGYNEQDYKCYSCRRPIGMVFGQSRLCNFDGHHYCSECHLGEKSAIPARILCNWDFNKYPISKRNQHFLTLISNEPMFELKIVAPLLYKNHPDLREIEELRCQAFFIRSYCFTCVQESISFELTKLVWPREHLIKQVDLYSLEDLIQIKSGSLKQTLKNVIAFGRQHVLSCVLCCQKGFICELCKSSQIIYPFDTESVHRCNNCQSIYHKGCFKSRQSRDQCPRCQRLQARCSDS